MKSFVALSFLLIPLLAVQPLNAQAKFKRKQLITYSDTDGYQVLSSIIDARTEKLKSESLSIFHQTISEETFRQVRAQCSARVPVEFQSALEDFDEKGKTAFLLQDRFSIHKKYRLVDIRVGVQTSAEALPGTYSLSPVGFDPNKTHAIVLVEYLVHPLKSMALGGDTTLYLLRRTEKGWQDATDVPKCGRIY